MAKKNRALKFVSTLALMVTVTVVGFVFLSPQFEKEAPSIELTSGEFWNLQSELKIDIKDNMGVKYYKVVFKDGLNENVLDSKVLEVPQKEVFLNLKEPKFDIFFKSKNIQIVVTAVDNSKWNFLEGNEKTTIFDVTIDTTRPIANVVANSLAINRGGSAIAVVEVRDDNLESAYITFNDENNVLSLTPFYKDGYYVSLIPWDVNITEFSQVSLIARDKAGNVTKKKIPLYIRPLKEKNDNIKISDNFIESVSKNVLEQSSMQIPNEPVEIFLEANKTLRDLNINKIKEHSRKYMDRSAIVSFDIVPFKRLQSSRTAAGFADRRYYFYNSKKIDEQWHLGMDWASIKQAPVNITNGGRVILNEYVGIYGNTIIVDHKMGLATLYSHLSSSRINIGDEVSSNQQIGNTGSTGAVLGDHLHFGVLVQGIEVNPLEWMDRNWIKTRITDILNEAKKKIDNK